MIETEIDNFKLNQEIAYKGEIGKIREEFCRQYIKQKQENFREIEQNLHSETRAIGENITCHKGCSLCCSEHVSVSLQETEAIAYYIYQNDSVFSHFLKTYPAWRARIAKNEALFEAINQLYHDWSASGFKDEYFNAMEEATSDYFAMDIPCPFLIHGACSIHEVRPYPCASVVATTPAEFCSPKSLKKPNMYIACFSLQKEVQFYRKPSHNILLTAPLAVYEILKDGVAWLSRLPGLESLEPEVMNDPEVKSIIEGYLQAGVSL